MTLEQARAALASLVPPTERAGRVRLETEGNVARVVLDHRQAHGALTVRMMVELADAVSALRSFEGNLVVVCGTDEPSFCSGGHVWDLEEAIQTQDAARVMSRAMTTVLDTLLDLPIPSVAAIGGPALGGGAEIATACDFRVMGDESRIQFVQARLGIAPGWGGTARLVRLLGRRKAFRVLCSQRSISPGEATEIGLADHRCGPDAVEGALAWLDDVRTLAPVAVRAVKRQLVARDPEEAVEAFAELWNGAEHKKALGSLRRPKA
jgi:ethylmalonyl-CoA/methylmalonyl-CoA decarboxylase